MSMEQQVSPVYRKLQQQISRATNEEEIRPSWVRALEQASGITSNAGGASALMICHLLRDFELSSVA